MAWVIRSSTPVYASGILVGVGDGVKVVGQKIDVLGYARQAEWAKVWGTNILHVDRLLSYNRGRNLTQ